MFCNGAIYSLILINPPEIKTPGGFYFFGMIVA